MKRVTLLSVALILVIMVIAACGGNTKVTQQPVNKKGEDINNDSQLEDTKEPVTLTFWNYGNTITDTEFDKLIVQPTKEKYPHITLERIRTDDDVTPEQLLAAGNLPDIIYTSTGSSYYRFLDIGIVQPLDELIKKHNVDISKVKPAILESIQSYTEDQSIIAVPLSFNLFITYYNKEIFDKFNVPYPSDEPQTWQQWLEIGRQLTRVDNGVQYLGIDVGGAGNLARSLKLANVDPATDQSTLADEQWEQVFELLKQQYEIPGFIGENQELVYDRTQFMQERRLAIRHAFLANMIGPLEELHKEGIELDWDIAPAAHFGDEKVPGSIHSLIVSNQGEHIEDAFLVVSNVLSDETQRLVARNGRVPSIINPELEKEFGADIEVLKGKKIENVFKLTPIANSAPHPLDGKLGAVLDTISQEIALNGKDVVSALRAGKEESDRLIKAWEATR
ncbi:ABC transporter substrate-binding protein [Paenibacillus endoradicis]|uniref:ABC transporter substrate-binding protein n=1 Tax=Paenibacillus endoradicis TaxID=2972487 RepID=UPI00215978B8|nr:ABC transporter substrate-binding protein [Paenibacillus endoradicis]MCR8658994.1 ABC transporter substrate-binding protein [Paenibacillus endoradicis]